MKDLRLILLPAMFLLAGGCSAPKQRPAPGVYEVVSVVEDPNPMPPAGPGERWFPYVPAAVDDGPPRHLLLREEGAVPLELAKDPVLSEDNEGRKQIALTLTHESGSALGELTSRLVGGRVAVVVGGDVISYHKIRQPILGDGVVISC